MTEKWKEVRAYMATVEMVDVSMTETVSHRLRGRHLQVTPATGTSSAVHAIEIAGWVLGRECPVVAVELLNEGNVCRRVPVNSYCPPAATIYPDVPEAAHSGFKINMSVLGLIPEIEFLVQAVLKDQNRVSLGVIRARRRWREDTFRTGPPLVSVVIPCYQQAHFLCDAIESVLAQTYPHLEIVVVDDGSSDNTVTVVSRYPGVRYIRQENQGLASARNMGLRQTIGEYLIFLDSDDRLLPNALDAGLRCFRENPGCGFVYGHCQFIAFDGTPMRGLQPSIVEGDFYLALLRGLPIHAPASVMYRREVFEDVGVFNVRLSPAADYDLYYRIASRFPVCCHGQKIVEYRKHGASMTRDPARMLRFNLAALRLQWQHVKRDRCKKEAYQAGIRFWKRQYVPRVVEQLNTLVEAGEWKPVIQVFWTLLRFCPSYLPLLMGDRSLPRKIQDWIARKARKIAPTRSHRNASQQLLQQIRQAVHTLIPSQARVIVVDKGDAGVLQLDGREEWHFPQRKEGTPETLLAGGLSKGSQDVAWIHIGSAYDFRLYAGKGRRKLLAAVKVMHTEGATLTAALEPVTLRNTTGAATILWDSGDDSESEVYVSMSPRFSGYYPLDSSEAITGLETLREKGAEFLLFPRTAFWWLEHYPEFKLHLEKHYRITADAKATDDSCIIFDLR
jgi:glycosyltransferase involved in cell wall biosynthesis